MSCGLKGMGIPSLLVLTIILSLQVSLAVDSISLSHSISDGMTIVSKNESFELGFFSPGNSKKRYVGIWYKNIPVRTIVWVANRASPINDSFGLLTVNRTGNLVLTHNNTVVWYTSSKKQAQNPVAQILDSGNLVVREDTEENPNGYLWQSFDYPSDTLLPGMKLGWDLRIGLDRNLTSWKSPDDPAPGDFSAGINLNSYHELYMMKGAEKYYRSGPWNGLRFNGIPQLVPSSVSNFEFISNKDEVYYTYHLTSIIGRSMLNQTNYLHQRFVWVEEARTWRVPLSFPVDQCDYYGLCGIYGNCIITTNPVCECLKGFKPKSPQAWNSLDWSQGCVRNQPLSCKNNSNDGFIKFQGLKLPETTTTLVDERIGLEECKMRCLNNCSCMAYANSDIKTGSGCIMWFSDLIDIREFSYNGQDLYIRMAASEIEAEHEHKKRKTKIIVAAAIISAISMLLFGSYCIYKFRRNQTVKSKNISVDQNDVDDLDLPLFDLSTIAIATNNFSNMNKLGEGGFGSVYKGKLENGQDIAVKRLSKSSNQGVNEFKNEVKLIAKLQHRNLVKLLGCSMQREEKMLVYEYMPNASLDSFIFDDVKGKLLDWHKRLNIICGIARGLLYLHQDSRLRIIHRDLKASNILLDDNLNAKISDFGLARMFGGDQTEGNTNRIVGTFGYMAPEYIADGQFSIKSDVFSFGVLILEIICGRRNRSPHHPNVLNLVNYAWKMWKVDRAFQLVDTNIKNSCVISEVLRCIHISLLCVQQFPEDRPSMSSVVPMLGGENEVVEPKLPAFFARMDTSEVNSSSSQKDVGSINETTISMLEAR